MTTLQELIKEFESIKKTKCKTLQKMMFFDGVLAIIESKYLEKEKRNLIDFHIGVMKRGLINEGELKWDDIYEPKIRELATKYYNKIYGTHNRSIYKKTHRAI
jgi:hypothetical protein